MPDPQGWTLVQPAPAPAAAGWTLVQPAARQPTAKTKIALEAERQLQRTDLPEDVRAELEAVRTGTASGDPMPAGQVIVGAAKGAGQTAVNLGKAVQMIPGVTRATDALYGRPGLSRAAMTEADQVLTPTNTAQRVGKIGEQIAEVVMPGQAIGRAAATAAKRAAPTLARALPEAAAKALPRVAVEATGAAGLAAAQGGDPKTAAVLGAAGPIVGQLTQDMPASLKEAAEKKVVQALGPTKERFKAIANRLAPEILKRGLGGSRQALQEQAAQTLESVGDQLDTALTQFGRQSLSTTPIVHALETAKDAFRTTTQMPVQQAVAKGIAQKATAVTHGIATIPVEFEPRAIKQLSGLQNIVQQLGDTATVDQLTAVRRAWDKVVSQAGGYAQRGGGAIGVPLKDQSEAFAKREGASAIRALIASDVPDLAAINKEYAFWKNLDDVLTQTLQRTQAQGPGLGKQVAEGIGAAAASSHGLGAAFGVGKVAKMANTVFTSPRWRMVDANLRNQLADAIANGKTGNVVGALSRIMAVQGSKMPEAVGAP